MNMPNRTAKFVSAIFASLLAGVPLATISQSTAGTADDCVSAPKDGAPQGSHWYYRVDRVTKRHCWYLREEGEKLSQTAPPKTSSAKPSPKADAAMQRSIADARAEFPAQSRFEQSGRGDEPAPAISADTAGGENSAITRIPDGGAPRSVIASRWPDPWAATASADPAPIKRDAVVGVSPPSQPQAPSVLAAGVAADVSSRAPTYSVQMQLAALMAALALAGMLGSAIFKFAGPRRPAQASLRARPDPGTIWQPTDDDRIVLPAHPETDVPARQPGFARGVDRRDNANDRIAEFFSQLSRRAPT
jgi:hypothetical protein